ncbi:MAG TPA: peroxiredoxin-like family protein [Methyloceanibacter sp.]|nr:peroxiredoxin-like family protein [Methyloceanibacter sp.]
MLDPNSVKQALAKAFQRADTSAQPLHERLASYLTGSRAVLPELEATYDERVERLAEESRAESLVPEIGQRLPTFRMRDTAGGVVELKSLLKQGPLVISFNRGPWCDYCGLELHALARCYPEIVAAGGEAISVVPETREFASILKETRNVPFKVATDVDLSYARSLGLVFAVGDKIKQMYEEFGLDLARFQGNDGWMLPIPATLVVGADGLVRARHVDPDFRHRMDMETILQAIQADGV